MIDGVYLKPLSQFPDYRGKVMKFSRSANNPMGENYFSLVHPGMVKAWHQHREMELNYVCLVGKVLIVLYDIRPKSFTYDDVMEIYLSPENYQMVHIPVGILNGIKGLGTTDSIIANAASIIYKESEMERFPLDFVEYDWFKRGN